ncbi:MULTISPECIES: DUF3014 domain-containing protein [Pseudoalteromonas]|uniref:DUF3014 domain-containing protein n=1 Tax=Pseudoalteromonas piscicida TaxID=43662 RepID=A0ABN5CC30_PSEO7|nr:MULTISPECIES: DUF3014 domain-containing protein [Pseudoalteromonas]ATD06960.1 hypothetical protein PPIS_a1899 [Pseudoalteromonas piscicida]MBR8841561.1 DUF3014 domain-containing protein [Pseudoalteromonas sp. JC3]MCG7552295.1 DUF3014 domain-containing protein [Pseudoalteromonas sp. Of11M-6]MCO7197598.1 DUF3014 domain-containing protein [Pseudoalteromonas sp. OANN1]MDP4487675.1 DUF3014 domain-containing protein [Pseudoalteromonas piscicida]
MSENHQEGNKRPSNSQLLFAAVVVLALIIVAVFVLAQKDTPSTENQKVKQDIVVPEQTETPLVNTARETPPEQVVEPEVTLPPQREQIEPEQVEPVEPEVTLPPLSQSDTEIKEAVSNYLSNQAVKLLADDDVIRRTVVYVDNLAKGKVAENHAPVVKPQDGFSVIDDDIIITDPNSYERYTPYVAMFDTMSTAQVVRLYDQYKPLFEEAYEEIGYEGDAFNGTLTDAIDELLATPIPDTALPLVKDSVTYKYAYAEWEQLSPAQKQFLRMGPENMKKVKKRLEEIKIALNK